MKEYLYCVFIILGCIDRPVFCWGEDHLTNNDVISFDKKDYNPHKDNTGESHIISDDKSVQNFEDRVFFPNDDDDFPSNNCNSTSRPHTIETCMNECHVDMDTNYDPVCGTDSVTYINLSQLECAMSCGVDVHIRQMSACPGWLVATTKPSSLKQNEELKSCLLLCPTTQEYNPVCGTNDVTYYNFGKLFCAQVCGIDVEVKRHYPCPKQPKLTTEPVATSSLKPYALSKEFLLCLQICPSTSEYNPVCGSNQKTYYNIAKLQCARNCGIDVTVLKRSPCFTKISGNLNTDDDKTSKIETRTQEVVQDGTISQDVIDRIFPNSEDDYT